MFNKYSLICIVCCLAFSLSRSHNDILNYRASPKLKAALKMQHKNDATLSKLDESLAQISTVYMQALFSGTHTAALDVRMRKLEIELFDLLDMLYKQERLGEYMKYEAEVTRQMILYNMLKKLFGYTADDNEKVK